MLGKYVYTVIMLMLANSVFSQHTVSGKITDTHDEPLIGATVLLLNAIDSTMLEYGTTNDAGIFTLKSTPTGTYILQATYVGYDDVLREIHAKGEKEITLENIVMQTSSQMIQEITVKAERIPMGIHGDTIIYNASAFKTKANANVEDLLKKMPGIRVDSDGNIKAHGKKVDHVLVDGKEFFGSDHRVATKNLDAHMIEKVEVYDKDSEIAEFTGVKDGKEEKTINLRLKNEHKKGGFGNIEVAGGSNNRYDGHGRYFRFSPTAQTSVILSSNNINNQTFGINDQISFRGGVNSLLQNGKNSITLNRPQQRDGINTATTGGINFSKDFSSKLSLSSDYMLRRNRGILDATSSTQNFTDKFDYNTKQKTAQRKTYQDHSLNSTLKFSPNNSWVLSSINNASWNNNHTALTQNTAYARAGSNAGNAQANQLLNHRNYGLRSENSIKYRFGNKSLITKATLSYQKTHKKDSLYNANYFGNRQGILHQDQSEKVDRRSIDISSRYTQRLKHNWHSFVSYGYQRSYETPRKLFYNITDTTKVLDPQLTAHLHHEKSAHDITAGVGRSLKKWRWNLSASYRNIVMKGNSKEQNALYRNSSHVLLPSAGIEYMISPSKSLSISYDRDVILPLAQQLSPIVDNTQTNVLYIGNPTLRPQVSQRVQLDHHMFDAFSSTLFFASMSWEHTQDKIVNSVRQDTSLFSTVKPINSKQYNAINLFANYATPIRRLGIDLNLSSHSQASFYESFINGKQSDVREEMYGLNISVNNRKQRHFSLEVGANIMHNIRRFRQYSDQNQHYTNIDYFAESAIYLPQGWTIDLRANYSTFTSASFARQTQFLVANGGVQKVFLKGRLTASLKVNDIFNNNRGYGRSTSAFSLEERNFSSIGRTFLLGIKYKIGKGSNFPL